MAGFGISGVEPPGSAITESVLLELSILVCFKLEQKSTLCDTYR